MIYFITARDINRVKIGFSDNPKKRLAQLSACAPANLKIEATLEGGRDFEAELHKVFSRLRLHGEWFEIDPAIEMAIHWANSGDPIPDSPFDYLLPFLPQRFQRIAPLLRGVPLFAAPQPSSAPRAAAPIPEDAQC